MYIIAEWTNIKHLTIKWIPVSIIIMQLFTKLGGLDLVLPLWSRSCIPEEMVLTEISKTSRTCWGWRAGDVIANASDVREISCWDHIGTMTGLYSEERRSVWLKPPLRMWTGIFYMFSPIVGWNWSDFPRVLVLLSPNPSFLLYSLLKLQIILSGSISDCKHRKCSLTLKNKGFGWKEIGWLS